MVTNINDIRELSRNPEKFSRYISQTLQDEPAEENPKKELVRNQPVKILLDWFCNVKGKRIEAIRQMKQRFLYLDYEDQIKVMDLFIERSKGYRAWCYEILTKWREPCYDDKLIELWKEYQDRKCAWTIVSQLPAEKVILVADSIVNSIYKDYLDDPSSHPYIPIGLYYTMCKKLVGCDGFNMNLDLLRYHCEDDLYLNLLNRAGIKEYEETCYEAIHRCIADRLNNYEGDFPGVNRNGNNVYTVIDRKIQKVLCEVAKMGYYTLAQNVIRWDIGNMLAYDDIIRKSFSENNQENRYKHFIQYSLTNLPNDLSDLQLFVDGKLEELNESVMKNKALRTFIDGFDMEVDNDLPFDEVSLNNVVRDDPLVADLPF